MQAIAVTYTAEALKSRAEKLAAELGLDLLTSPQDKHAGHYAFLLILSPEYTGLQDTQDKKFAPFYIDFLGGKLHYRRTQASLRKELLARAIGIKPRDNPVILDATAGLGRDSFILATLGYQVTMLERSPILHCLLQDALRRAAQHPPTEAIVKRMTLHLADALVFMRAAAQPPGIIYLDPMFPQKNKTAKSRKDLQILQSLVGPDTANEDLLPLALTCAANRVVVKRPRLSPPLPGPDPTYTLMGSSSRFDVYICRTAGTADLTRWGILKGENRDSPP